VTKVCPGNANREDGFSFSKLWKFVIHSVKEGQKVPSKDKTAYFILRSPSSIQAFEEDKGPSSHLLPAGALKGLSFFTIQFSSCDKKQKLCP
jgi:hypothetical protein